MGSGCDIIADKIGLEELMRVIFACKTYALAENNSQVFFDFLYFGNEEV